MTVCFYFHFVVVADLINVSHFLGFSSSSPGRVGLSFLPFDLVPKTFSSHLPSLPSPISYLPFLPFFSPSLIQPLSNLLLLISYSPLLLLSQTILWISERARTKTSTFPFMSSSLPPPNPPTYPRSDCFYIIPISHAYNSWVNEKRSKHWESFCWPRPI